MDNYSPKPLVDRLLEKNAPLYSAEFFRKSKKRGWEAAFRRSLRDILAIPPLSRRIELTLLKKEERGGYCQETYLAQGEGAFPLVVLTPEKGNGSCLLALNGHGPGVSAMTGDREPEECHHNFGRTLVRAGFTVVMTEILGFGDCRLKNEAEEDAPSSCQTLAMQLLPLGYTLTGLRLWQCQTILDFVEERYGNSGLGCFGFSGGGLLGYLLTALDDRIRALGLTGYCSTFEESIYEHTHCADNYIPGLFRLCDQPEIAWLIAPRPLYVEAGRQDRVFPFAGAVKARERMSACYDQPGCRDSFCFRETEGGHEIDGRDMIEWFREVLS